MPNVIDDDDMAKAEAPAGGVPAPEPAEDDDRLTLAIGALLLEGRSGWKTGIGSKAGAGGESVLLCVSLTVDAL